MGIRFRKSIQFGPLRINLSKSGIGWSVGGKGARFTKKAGGGYRTTVGVPGTGVSYVKDHTGEQSKSAQKPEQRPYRPQALQDMEAAEGTAARGGKYDPSRKDPGKKRGRKPRIALFIVILLVIYGGFQLLKNEISTGETVSAEDIPASAVWYPDSRVQFETYPGNVSPGDRVSLSIDSAPNTRHTITVLVDGAPMQSTDLIAQETDLTAHAAWSWTVPDDATPGQSYILVAAGDFYNCIDYAVLDSAGNVVGDAPDRTAPYGHQPEPEIDDGEMEMEITPPDTETDEPPVDAVDTPIVEDMPEEPETGVTVYVTDTGTKYHNSGCRYLSESSRAIDLDSAIVQGYTACQACH